MKGQSASHGQTKTHRKMGATGGGQVSLTVRSRGSWGRDEGSVGISWTDQDPQENGGNRGRTGEFDSQVKVGLGGGVGMKGQSASHGQTKTHRKMGATGGGQVSLTVRSG